MAISDWMPTLIARLGTITGLAVVGTQPHRVRGYSDLPATLLELPTMIVLPLSATVQYNGSMVWWYHEVQATLYISPTVLPEAFQQAIPYIKLVRDKMAANLKLGGLSWSGNGGVDDWVPSPEAPFTQGPGRVTYAGVDNIEHEYLGIIFRMRLKEHEEYRTVA